MADRAISDLTPASQVTTSDLFVLEQNNTAKSLTGQILINDLATALDGHGGISSIAKTGTSSLVDTYTITYADESTSTYTVTNGKGISSYTQYWAVSDDNANEPSVWHETLQTMTDEFRYLWSYIHLEFNDGSDLDTTAQVIGVYGDTGHGWYVYFKYASAYPTQDSDMGDSPDNFVGIYSGTASSAPTHYTDYIWYGWKGIQGNTGTSITGVAKTSTSGLVDTYTVSFSNGNTSTFTVTNGSNISTIAKTSTSGLIDNYTVTLTNGNTTQFSVTNAKSIVSVTMTGGTHAAGTTDTYTILFNDGDSATFQVYNGANGAGAVSSVAGIQAVDGDVPLILTGNGAPTTATVGQENQLYFDYSGSVLYICLGENGGTYSWQGAGVTVDSALSTSSTNPVQNKIITAKVGTTALNTTATDLSNAVNELANDIGNMSLTTSASDLTGAVNELDGDISTINTAISGIPAELANRLKLDGTSTTVWMGNTHNLNDFHSGVVLADENVVNVPASAWFFVTAAGDNYGTVTQVAYNLRNSSLPMTRYCASGAWSAWSTIPAVNKTGDTMTGNLVANGAYIVAKSTNLTSNTTVGSATSGDGRVYLRDSNGTSLGILYPYFRSDGKQGVRLLCDRFVNNVEYVNTIEIGIDSSATRYVDLGYAQSAWLEALGLGSTTTATTISNIISAASGATITSAYYAQWGKVAQVTFTFKYSSAISTSNVTVGTLVSGKRPALSANIIASTGRLFGTINDSGVVTVRVAYGISDLSANSEITMRAIYLLP